MEKDARAGREGGDGRGEGSRWLAGIVIKRMSRQERREQTRGRLLDAAAQVFARRGFASATLDEVAEAAGYTKGAVYSNFEGKNDLFIALIERRIEQQTEEASALLAQSSLQEAFEKTAEAGEPDVTADADWMALACEFWLYARHDERAREAMARQYERARTISAGMLEAKYAEAGMELPMPARDLAILSEALGVGLLFQHLIDPAGVPMGLLNRAILRLHGQPMSAEEPAAGGVRGGGPSAGADVEMGARAGKAAEAR